MLFDLNSKLPYSITAALLLFLTVIFPPGYLFAGPADTINNGENNSHELSQLISDYEETISRLRRHYRPYDPLIGEHLTGLGIARQLTGDHKKALKNLREALFINRVNSGFYSLRHVRLLELILKSNLALEDWTAVDKTYSHIYWLYQRNYSETDLHWLPLLKTLYTWHKHAAYLKTDRLYEEHEELANEYHARANRIILQQTGDKKLITCFWKGNCCALDAENNQEGKCISDQNQAQLIIQESSGDYLQEHK